MIWNKHEKLEGQHAFMSASKYHWINYDDDKLIKTYQNMKSAEYGTVLHDFAHLCIILHQHLPSSRITLNAFVNDAIDYGMQSEQVLYYSDVCFGTTDAISFTDNFLRIHDLKTGTEVPGHMEQLLIYAALFCLEYGYEPKNLKGVELRIYQFDDIIVANPEPEQIKTIMKKIVHSTKVLNKFKEK